jgi:hypothetical protein
MRNSSRRCAVSAGNPNAALALVHYPVKDRLGAVNATSITPLNLHDLARSAATFGVAPFYVVTPLLSQQALAKRILAHWSDGYGGEQNPSRRESLRAVRLVSSVNEASEDIFRHTGSYPRLAGTAAAGGGGSVDCAVLRKEIDSGASPWLLLFGTGYGLTKDIVSQCDALLDPIRGPGKFNHLSVRSAAAIILDRLFGK